MTAPLEFIREQGVGIMLAIRLPSGNEVVFVGGMQHGSASQADIDDAIKFLRGLRNEPCPAHAHTGGCDE
jgi:hypothetical protein